jgi:hypothetical protein
VSVAEDQFGTATASGTATATIITRALAGQMVLNSATEGTALANTTAVATFSDTVGSDAAGDFTATINWGDGVTTSGTVVGSAGSFTVEGGHTYADEGSNPASVTLIHTADQVQATASGTVSAAEGDSLTPHGATIGATVGQAFNGAVATFSDTDTANGAGDFAATINWGDGTTTAGTVSGSNGSFSVNGTHTYTQTAVETVKIKLTDDAPGTATATATSLIFAVDPPHNATVGNWLQNASTPMLATSFSTPGSGSQPGGADHFAANGLADLLFQDTNGGPVNSGAPDSPAPPSIGGPHRFSGADGGAGLLAWGDSAPSGSLHGTLAGR